MSALTTRDALAKALHEFYCHYQGPQEFCSGPCELNADALIASGAVVDATTLADDVKLRLGVAAAQAIRDNLPVDAFGDARRLKDYADIWGAAARNAVLAALTERSQP